MSVGLLKRPSCPLLRVLAFVPAGQSSQASRSSGVRTNPYLPSGHKWQTSLASLFSLDDNGWPLVVNVSYVPRGQSAQLEVSLLRTELSAEGKSAKAFPYFPAGHHAHAVASAVHPAPDNKAFPYLPRVHRVQPAMFVCPAVVE